MGGLSEKGSPPIAFCSYAAYVSINLWERINVLGSLDWMGQKPVLTLNQLIRRWMQSAIY